MMLASFNPTTPGESGDFSSLPTVEDALRAMVRTHLGRSRLSAFKKSNSTGGNGKKNNVR